MQGVQTLNPDMQRAGGAAQTGGWSRTQRPPHRVAGGCNARRAVKVEDKTRPDATGEATGLSYAVNAMG
jgi:hypothetical protein